MGDMNENVFVIEKALYSLIAYPEEELYDVFYVILNKQHRALNRNWIARRYTINSLTEINEPIDEVPWNEYRKAKEDIKPYCNSEGLIIKKNSLTKHKYMEVYAWEQMLKRPECTRIANFDRARRMQAAGYLDVYVLFSLYHIDLYGQYRSFSAQNKEKIRQYIETYLIEK